MGVGALHDMKLLSQSFHLALDLANPKFEVLVLRRICFLVIALGWHVLALILFWWGLIFILTSGTSLAMIGRVLSFLFHLSELDKTLFRNGRPTGGHLSHMGPSNDGITMW